MKRTKLVMLIALLVISDTALADLNTGLVAYYPFSNNTNDASGNKNNGINHGAILASDRFGNINSAYSFDGISSYIEVLNSTSLNMTSSISVSFWIKPSGWSDYRGPGIISKKTNDGTAGYVVYDDGFYTSEINFRMLGTTGIANYLHSNSNVDVGTWQHWIATYDSVSKTARLYKNGIMTVEYTNTTIGDMTSTAPLHIGHSQTWNGFFKGVIDDLSIYNRALSTTEVQQLYQTGISQYVAVNSIQDIDGDGHADQALLFISNGQYYLNIISGATGKQLNKIVLGTNLIPTNMTAIYTQITILSTVSDGTNILQTYDAVTGSLIRTISLTK